MGDFYLPPFTYFFNHLFISGDVYFILWIIIRYDFILLFKLFYSGYWELFQLFLCPFNILPSLWFFSFFSTSLFSGTTCMFLSLKCLSIHVHSLSLFFGIKAFQIHFLIYIDWSCCVLTITSYQKTHNVWFSFFMTLRSIIGFIMYLL